MFIEEMHFWKVETRCMSGSINVLMFIGSIKPILILGLLVSMTFKIIFICMARYRVDRHLYETDSVGHLIPGNWMRMVLAVN
jgi:hypothetical protein